LLKTIRFAWRLGAFLVATLLFWLFFWFALILGGKHRRLRIINWWVPRWAATSLRIFAVEVIAEGPHVSQGKLYPAKGSNGLGRIFVSNHVSTVDIPLIFTVAEAHMVSRHDLAQWPIIGRGARSVGTLFVDRKSRRSGANVLRQVAHTLEDGEGVAMFPEGSTFPGDEVHEFHNGAFSTARRSGAEVIPLGIAYEDDEAQYHHEKVLAHVKRLTGLPRVRVAVVMGEPLAADADSTAEMKELGRERVQELVHEARRLLGN